MEFIAIAINQNVFIYLFIYLLFFTIYSRYKEKLVKGTDVNT
jgi:hypothetical protein